jgi:tetratricopeptide (TPR) repeat protein
MKSIFLSSTKVDLNEHRLAVDVAIRRLKQRPINMDDFGSQPGGASGTSAREVDQADIYIGILAHRYGYVPVGMDRSVTEQEYDRAVERNMPRLMYMVDPAFAWPEEFIEKDDPAAAYSAQEKLDQFKTKVGKAEVRSLFTTPADLAAKVTIDLINLLDEDRRQQRFFRVLAAVVIIIIVLVGAFMTIPEVKNRVVEIAGIASATATPTFTATLTATPTATFTPTPIPTATATPLEGTPFAAGDVGVVFADFHKIDADAPNTDENIERELQNEQIPFIHVHHTLGGREEAQQIAQQYHATIVIWGEIALGGASISFEINPAEEVDTVINGLDVSATQLDNFAAYVFQGMDVLYIVDFIRGQVNFFRGDYATALVDFNSAARRIPAGREQDVQTDALYFYRATAQLHLQNYDLALTDFNRVLLVDPNLVAAYNNRGMAYYSLENFDLALADFNQAIQLDPTQADAYFNRGTLYHARSDAPHALADFTQAIQLRPDNVQTYLSRSNIYFQQGDYAHALDDANQALQLDPNRSFAYTTRGTVYLGLSSQQRDPDQQIKRLEQAVADLRHAQALGEVLPPEVEGLLTDFETMLGITSTPETILPAS